jgi:hypothetical protein
MGLAHLGLGFCSCNLQTAFLGLLGTSEGTKPQQVDIQEGSCCYCSSKNANRSFLESASKGQLACPTEAMAWQDTGAWSPLKMPMPPCPHSCPPPAHP